MIVRCDTAMLTFAVAIKFVTDHFPTGGGIFVPACGMVVVTYHASVADAVAVFVVHQVAEFKRVERVVNVERAV